MKHITLFLMALVISTVASAQVGRWIIPPIYNNIEIAEGADILITDSARSKTLWSFNGRRLATTTDDLFPFANGHAVTTRPGTAYITAIYDTYGRKTPVSDYQLGWGHPFFADGYLLVHNGQYYSYMDGSGQVDNRDFAQAYPFSGGFAAVFSYENLQKRKSPFYMLLDTDLQTVPLRVEGKQLSKGELEFISSVNEEGVGIVVAKHKVYFFDAATKSLQPVFATPEEHNTKNQAKLEGSLDQSLSNMGDSAMMLRAKCGHGERVEIVLGSFMTPTEINRNGEQYTYKTSKTGPRHMGTNLRKHLGENNKLAIYWGDKEVMPPQFTTIPLCFGDKALIKENGLYGVLRVQNDASFRLSINKGKPLAFLHKKIETTIRLDMPPFVNPADVTIEMDPAAGCEIDKLSRQSNTTTEGNFVQYGCILNIPPGLTDEVKPFNLTARVKYNGLLSSTLSANAEAWHYKYYTVDINEQDATIKNNMLSFNFDISADRNADDAIYPHTATLVTDGLTFDIEKVSETRYKCKVYDLHEGTNNIVVQILEEGCPPSNYGFEIDNVKQVSHSASKPNVTIRKKNQPKPRPVLEL